MLAAEDGGGRAGRHGAPHGGSERAAQSQVLSSKATFSVEKVRLFSNTSIVRHSDYEGKSALDIAAAKGDKAALKVLLVTLIF